MNDNNEYELLVQDIYQTIAKDNNSATIDVKHNVKMVGKSGQEHQIDVYYEFCFMGELHKVIIECKNYSNTVSIGKIRDFHGVLSDIGNVKGIFISKNGFQKGAIKYAEHYGIILKELRFPNLSDWKGTIKTIEIDINLCSTRVTSREFVFDNEWVKSNFIENKNISIQSFNNEIVVENKDGKEIANLYLLEQKLKCLEEEPRKDLNKTFGFGDDAYLKIPGYDILKIKEIRLTYDVLISIDKIRIDGDSFTKAIMIDVFSGEKQFFRKEIDV